MMIYDLCQNKNKDSKAFNKNKKQHTQQPKTT